jgi:polar amino acid transport system substrate-binding protein
MVRFFRAFILLCVVWSCPANAQSKSTYDEILERGKLLAGVRADFPPFGRLDESGNFAGFGIDLAREFAKHLGVKVEFVQTTSANRIPLLLNRQIDADIGTTSPTRARNEVVDFTYTIAWTHVVVVVPKGKNKDPNSNLNDSTTVGTVQGSVYIDQWKKRYPNAKIKLYQEFPELFVALAQGQVDVALANETTVRESMERNLRLDQQLDMGEAWTQESTAIGVRQNDSKWRNWINWTLQRMWAEGTFQTIYKKHFKTDPPFHIWENGQLQPGVTEIGKDWDKW